jgi:hypothetical protein
MTLTNTESLIRGAAFFNDARSVRDNSEQFSVPDLIGVIAAYADHCGFPMTMEDGLNEIFPRSTIERLIQTLQLFNDPKGNGLWCQGDDVGNFRFTDERLIAMYPGVNEHHQREFGNWKPGHDETYFGRVEPRFLN